MIGFDADAADRARARQAELVKPPGSLGRLEALAVWLAGVTGSDAPEVRARVVIAAADHGVTAENVSALGPEVTGQMLRTLLRGGAAVSVLSQAVGADLVCVDAGVTADTSRMKVVRSGLEPSANLATEPALARADVDTAIKLGRRLARQASEAGMTILVGGDMGVGNTTPATCLTCWLTGRSGLALAGAGSGLDAEGVNRKAEVISRALRLHAGVDDPRDALACFGGGELAVLTGVALGAGEYGLGFVCDGVVATAGAAIAARIEPGLPARMLAGHRSPEPAHRALLEQLGLEPVLDLGVRLGEGSGAVAALAILKLAAATHNGMMTFAAAGVSAGPATARA